jgi:hypothetical protein
VEYIRQGVAYLLAVLELIGAGAGPARILDFLSPRFDFGHVARNCTPCTPEIDLEGQRVLARLAFEHPLQGRVRDHSAIPIALAFDLHRREAGRQSAAGHHVLGPDDVGGVVEIDEIAGADIDRTDAETHLGRIDAIEVDKILERGLELSAVVVAGRFDGAGRLQPRCRYAPCEKCVAPCARATPALTWFTRPRATSPRAAKSLPVFSQNSRIFAACPASGLLEKNVRLIALTKAIMSVAWSRRSRNGPFSVAAASCAAPPDSGGVVTSSQNLRSFSKRASGGLPAIRAELIAPTEMPATQSG